MYLNIQMFGGRGAYSRQYKINSKSVTPSTSSQTKASMVSKDDVNKLLNIANENEPQITADLQEIISKTSGNINYDVGNGKTALDFRKKGFDSLERKMNSDLKEKSLEDIMNGTYDIVRYTDLVESDKFVDDYYKIMDELTKKGYKVQRVKNTFNDDTKSYKGVNTVVESPTGYKFELQYHTPESMKVKEINHKLYEMARLDTTSEEEKAKLRNEMNKNSNKLEPIPKIDKINNFDNLKKSKESVANSIEKPTRHYYEINEQRAKYAHQMYSMRDYKENQTTNMYKAEVDGVYEMALEAKTKCNNDQEKIKKIDYLTDKFSKQYAEWLNKESELKLRYPSQMITGAGGWTPNKIARKESAFNSLFNEFKTINKIKEDIKNEPFKVKRNETKGVAVQSDRYESKYFKVIQNEQENRLQLKFDGKPDEETRSLLKKNGYKFSPSRGVWQRQLTNNARYSVRLINEALDKMNKK